MKSNDDWKTREKNYHKKRLYELLNYDKNHHLELLTNLTDPSNSKLCSYSAILLDQVNWEIQNQYLELLKMYLEEEIELWVFKTEFFERYTSAENVAQVLISNRILLSPDERSLEFGKLLSQIENACESESDNSVNFETDEEIVSVEFRILIENIYLEIQKILKKN